MKKPLISFTPLFFILILFSCNTEDRSAEKTETVTERPEYVVVIHGGAGYRNPGDSARDQQYIVKMRSVLNYGSKLCAAGTPATTVVEKCLNMLEDDTLFNAGKGAVFAADGTNKLDASIMDGATHNSGAVCGVSTIKNPITAAKLVMDSSEHVMLSGPDAELYARIMGLNMVEPTYFFTQSKMDRLLRAQSKESHKKEKHGTVGCVVLDKHGNLAAGTSTGGMTNKKYGRIGDSPVIGAGTYAENGVCAISATGHGEYFIRYVVAHDIAARMKYGGLSLDSASNEVINKILVDAEGSGGIISVDQMGNISMPFNTTSMFRGYVTAGKKPVVLIYH